MSQSIFVGLDLGSNHCQQTVINSDGEFVSSRSIPTSEFHLRVAFAALGKKACVHLEASELAPWVCSIISPLVNQVVVSHPRSMAWIGKDSLKDDSIDARKLAELLRLNQVHPVYYESADNRRQFKHLVTLFANNWHTIKPASKRKSKPALELSALSGRIRICFQKAGSPNCLIRSTNRL